MALCERKACRMFRGGGRLSIDVTTDGSRLQKGKGEILAFFRCELLQLGHQVHLQHQILSRLLRTESPFH